MHYDAGGAGQEAFYLSHILGRNVSENLNVSVDIPGLNPKEVLLDAINAPDYLPANTNSVPWDQPEVLWGWIMDYVSLNRLQQHFASAFEAFGALAYQPKWPTLEACVWQSAQLVLNLPMFSPTRARIRGTIEGEQYAPSSLPYEFMMSEGTIPKTYTVKCAIMNYAVWLGYYALIDNEARSRSNWRTAFNSKTDYLAALSSPAARACAASVIFGHEVVTNATHGCGVYINTDPMASVTMLAPIEALEDSQGQVQNIDSIFAPVTGCLLIGAVSGDFIATSHLRPMYSIPAGLEPRQTISGEKATQIASLYRLFGHEVDIENVATRRELTPWSNWRECVVEPSSSGFGIGECDMYRVMRNRPREGRNRPIASVHELLNGKGATVNFQKPQIQMSEWQKRTIAVKPYISNVKARREVKFLIKSGFGWHPDTFRAKGVPMTETLDFGEVQPSFAPTTPSSKEVPEGMDVRVIEGSSTAEGVGSSVPEGT